MGTLLLYEIIYFEMQNNNCNSTTHTGDHTSDIDNKDIYQGYRH